jgi:hypothetical protein
MPGIGNKEFIKMRKTFLLITLLAICFSAHLQTETNDVLKSRFKPGVMWNFTGLRPAEAGKAHKYDRLVFDLTYNDWFGDLKTFKNQWSSIGLNTNLLFDISLNPSSSISFGTGIRHSLFRTENLANLFAADPTNTFTMVSNGANVPDVKRRLLCGNSIGIPLELRFRTKNWQHVKLHIGGTISYQMNVYAKSVLSGPDGRQVVKDYNFADVNRLALSAHARIGIRNWALFGSYGINPMFMNRSSAKLQLFQLGLSASLF